MTGVIRTWFNKSKNIAIKNEVSLATVQTVAKETLQRRALLFIPPKD